MRRRLDSEAPLTWRDVGNWTDTEGSIITNPGENRVYVFISQAERKILEEIQRFLESEKIPSQIVRTGAIWSLEVSAKRTVRKFLQRIRPYLRTARKRRQYKQAQEFLRFILPRGAPRKVKIPQWEDVLM